MHKSHIFAAFFFLFLASSLLAQTSNLYVGSNTAGNTTNFSSGTNLYINTYIGYDISSSNNALDVVNAGTLLSNSANLYVGYYGSSNSLIISNGGEVVSQSAIIGQQTTSSNNSVLVTGVGSLWSNRLGSLAVGGAGSSNSLIISNGGEVVSQGAIIGQQITSSNNSVLVTGVGSLWSNRLGSLAVGAAGSGNSLIISNGGEIVDQSAGIGQGPTSSNNSVLVTGAGSLWSNNQALLVSRSGMNNSLTISDNASVLVGSNLTIALQSNSIGTLNFGSFGGNDAAGSLSTPLITLGAGQATINYNQTNILSITSAITGSGTIQQLGSGTTIMSGSNSYAGTTHISNGKLALASASALGVSDVTLGGFDTVATLSLLTNATIASLTWGTNGIFAPTIGRSDSTMQQLTITEVMSNNNGGFVDFGNYSLIGTSTIINFAAQSGFSVSDFIALDNGVADNNWEFVLNDHHLQAIFTQSINTNSNLYVGDSNSGNVVDLYTATNTYNYTNTYIGYQANASNNILNVANAGVVLNNSSNVYVGYDGNNNMMAVFNNGLVTNINGYIGFNVDASNNTALITSGGAWKMSQGLYVGNLGSRNTLVLSNGGVVSGQFGEIGYDINSSGNEVIITGSNSVWSNINTNNLNSNSYIYVGGLGSSNSMIIADGGVARDQFGAVGWGSSSSNNSVLVTGYGSLWTNGSNVYIGNLGSKNTMVISNGGTVLDQNGYVGWASNSSNNSVLVTGAGSLWSNSSNLYIGANDQNNISGQGTVTVANGGVIDAQTITIGANSTLNNGLEDGTTTSGTIKASSIELEGGTFALNETGTSTITTAIQGDGSLLQNGSGMSILSGDNSYSGTTTILNGVLMAGSSNAFGASDVVLGGSDSRGIMAMTSNLSSVTIESLRWGSNGVVQINPSSQVLSISGSMSNTGGGGTFIISEASNETNTLITFGSQMNFTVSDFSLLGITGYSFILNNNNVQGYFSTNANVINTSGMLLLKNTLKVASYSQMGNGTLEIAVSSPNSYGNIEASQDVNLGGMLKIIPGNNTPLTYGEKLTIITAQNSINGTFDSTEVEQEGCRARLQIVGDPQVIVYIAPTSYTEMAQNQNQVNVAGALNSFIPATSGDEMTVSTALDQLSASQYGAAFNQIMPTLYQSLSTIAFNLYNANNMELIQRLWGARVMGGGFSMGGFGDNTPIIQEPTHKVDKNDILRPGAKNPWGIFIDGSGIFAQANSANALPTYQAESGGVTTGLTYHWNDSFVSGIYTGYQGVYTKYSGGAGSLIDNSVRFGLFGTYGQKEGKGFFVDGLIGGDYSGYTMQRNINFGTINRTATGNPGAGELDAMVASGYDLKKGNWTYGPLMSLQYAYFGVSPFNETGANSLDLNNVSWNTSSMIYSLGSHVAYRWQANKDLAVVPQINLSWQHEFLQNPYNIGASLGGLNFNNSSSTPLRDTLYTGIGVSLEFAKKWDASFFYNASAGNTDLVSQNIFLTLGMKF